GRKTAISRLRCARSWRLALAHGRCPLWVKSGHQRHVDPCPLYPQKRTLVKCVGMSALCQKRTHAVQQNSEPYPEPALVNVSFSQKRVDNRWVFCSRDCDLCTH